MTTTLPLPDVSSTITLRRGSSTRAQVERDPVAAAMGGQAWAALGARRLEALVKAPDQDPAQALERLVGALASLVASGVGRPAIQLVLSADPVVPSVTAVVRLQVTGGTPHEARSTAVIALEELDQVLDGCPALRAVEAEPARILPALAHGRLAVPALQQLRVDGLPPILLPPEREPRGPRALDEVLRLLLAQHGRCAVVATVQRCAALPRAAMAAGLASAAYAEVRTRLDGLEVHVDEHRQRIRRYPADLARLEAMAPRLRTAANDLAAMARDPAAVRVVAMGEAEPTGPLLRAVQAAWLGVHSVGWRELSAQQCAEWARGPLAALACPVSAHEGGAVESASEHLALHLPASLAGTVLALPAPVDDQGWPGLPVDPAPVRALPLVLRGTTGVLLGRGDADHRVCDVRLSEGDLARHLYVCGKTGVGKSTLLRALALDLALAGGGLGVIDPHGDLVDDLAEALAPHREVVVFDPTAASGPGLDPVAHDGSHEGMERVCEELTAMMFRLYDRNTMGPMFDRYSRALILPLLAAGGSLGELSRVAHDRSFRTDALSKLDDSLPLHAEVQRFWKHEHPSWGSSHTGEMNSYVLSKYDALVRSSALRRTCDPTRSQLDIAGLADRGAVVLARLPEGRLGAVSAWFLGMLLVARLQDAIFARSRQAAGDRRPFTLILDEFQHFLGGGGFSYTQSDRTLAPLLSEARKFGLRLVLANQYVAQLDSGTREAVLGNVGSMVAFRVGAQDADILGRELGVDPAELREQPLYRAAARLLADGTPAPVFTLKTIGPG